MRNAGPSDRLAWHGHHAEGRSGNLLRWCRWILAGAVVASLLVAVLWGPGRGVEIAFILLLVCVVACLVLLWLERESGRAVRDAVGPRTTPRGEASSREPRVDE